MILERIKTGVKKRKFRVFLVFLFFSTLAWLINNLSQSFVSTTKFDLSYVNVPDAFLLAEIPKSQLNVKLKAVGFQFLGFGIKKKTVQLDLSKANKKGDSYYITQNVYKRQIENQLPKTITLLEVDTDTIFLDFTKVVTKEVPVVPRLNFSLAKNYMLEEDIVVRPATIKIKGPKKQIDTIESVRTAYIDLVDIDKDFAVETVIIKSRELNKTTFTPNTIELSAKVYRFSEKEFSVPVTMVNVPTGTKVRMFPDVVTILCQGKIEALKTLSPNDFAVTADYLNLRGSDQSKLPISITAAPEDISNASLSIEEIEFILRVEE